MIEQNLREKLIEKGWEQNYVDKAVSVFEEDERTSGSIIKKLDKVVYWIAMFIAIGGNFIISIILIPFLVTITNKIALGIIIFAISLTFGFLFNVLLKDIEELDQEHHIIAGIFLPSIGLINIFVITNVANHFVNLFRIQSKHNPVLIGTIYFFAFVLPYVIDKVFKGKRLNKKSDYSQ